MKTTKKKIPKTRQNGKIGKPLPIAKIRELYHGEWLAVQLTEVDRYDNPIAGVVVARATTSDALYSQAKEYRLRNPKAQLYTFFAGNYIPEGWVVVLNFSQ